MLSHSLKILLFLLVFSFSVNIAFSCTSETIFQCFEQGNYNLGEWSGNLQFQLFAVLALLIMIAVLLKGELEKRLHVNSKTASLMSWILMISLFLAVSFTQQNDAILNVIFLIAVLPLILVSYLAASKIKGDDVSWFGSPRGLFSLVLFVYLFLRLTYLFFGTLDVLAFLPFEEVIDWVFSVADVLLIGAIAYFNYSNNYKKKTGNELNWGTEDGQNPGNQSNPLVNGTQRGRSTSKVETFPSLNISENSNFCNILKLKLILQKRIIELLKEVESEKRKGNNSITKIIRDSLLQVLDFLRVIENHSNRVNFYLKGYYNSNQKPDYINVVVASFTQLTQDMNSDINHVEIELRKLDTFIESVLLEPKSKNPNDEYEALKKACIYIGAAIYYNIGSWAPSILNDDSLHNQYKILCDSISRRYGQNSIPHQLSQQMQQFKRFDHSNKEIIRNFINSL